MPTCPSRSTDAYIRNAWCSFRKYTLELSARPSAPLELKIRMLRAEVLETMLYDCVTWSPRACHYDTLRRAHYRFLTRCIGWRKHNQSRRPPDFLSGHACQNGKCVFSSHSFWTSSSLDVPAGVTQEEGHTGFLIHLLSAVHALIFLARRIQPFLSLVDCEVEFCVLTI